jgi:zinc D-Ala-D-Ala carboxypeptidase
VSVHNGPSPHLAWTELACKTTPNPTPYPGDWRETRLPCLCCAFEAIRAIYGTPLRVTSAYRTKLYNAMVGGAPKSQHPEGRALDVEPPEGVPVRTFYNSVCELATRRPDLGIHYVKGYAGGWVHFDLRAGTALITEWEG